MNSDFCIAVHALVYLNHKQCLLSSEMLAENVCTNPVRVRRVMGKLKKVKLVETKEGSEGGYLFLRDAAQVSLADIAKALEISFVSTHWHSGDHDMKCLVASGMADIMDGIFGELNEHCMKWLEEKTIADIDRNIFG